MVSLREDGGWREWPNPCVKSLKYEGSPENHVLGLQCLPRRDTLHVTSWCPSKTCALHLACHVVALHAPRHDIWLPQKPCIWLIYIIKWSIMGNDCYTIHLFRFLWEKYRESTRDIYIVFINLEKEYDSIPWKRFRVTWKLYRFLESSPIHTQQRWTTSLLIHPCSFPYVNTPHQWPVLDNLRCSSSKTTLPMNLLCISNIIFVCIFKYFGLFSFRVRKKKYMGLLKLSNWFSVVFFVFQQVKKVCLSDT